jgi:hypothetical protein
MKFVKHTAVLCIFLSGAAAVFFITSCQKARLCYITQKTEAAAPEDVLGQEIELHYFFDKTESMKGFTWEGDDSEYVNALDSIWKSGENIWPDVEAVFYEYGELNISKLPKANIQREVGFPEFYGQINSVNRAIVRTSSQQPFGAVSDYIKSLDTNKKCLYVVVTDLYEQNRANNIFTLFFRSAFESGMSGAFFAVDSSFRGNLWNISINSDVSLGVNGRSTFFILVAGSGKEVAQYSERLVNEFNNKNLDFEDIVFMVQADEKPELWVPDVTRMAQNERRFNSDENKYALVNLRAPKSNKELRLYEWIEDSAVRGGYRSAPAVVESYRLMTNIGSRYFAGLPVANVNLDDFEYSVNLSVEYFGGSNSRVIPGELSKFGPAQSSLFSAMILSEADISKGTAYNDTNYPLYFLLEIKNKPLDTGYYRIGYSIVPEAKIPVWVAERSVPSLAELKDSIQPGKLIKVLNLKTVYEDIVSIYNGIKTREIYSGSFYIVKQH